MSENTQTPVTTGKLEFTKEEVQYFKDFVDGSVKVAKSSKEIFKAEFKLYKLYPKHPLKVKALSRRTISSITDDDNLIARVKKISNLAESYTKHRVISKFDMLYFYNIEKIVGIFDLLVKNDKQDLERELRKIIADVYKKEESQTEYNNHIKVAIAEFMKDNNMKEDADGNFDFAEAFDVINALLAQMDIVQLQKIADAVSEAKKHPHEETPEVEEEVAA